MTRKTIVILLVCLLLVSMTSLSAQNRGTVLSFQGIEKALTYSPGAFGPGLDGVADLGKTGSIFSNPAGLSGLKSLSLSLGYASNDREWWENQNYKPNRLFVTLPFYLEGLYIPDPANNGLLDSDVFFEGLADTAYVVSDPEMGVEHFSEEAADWKQSQSLAGPSHLGIALPLNIAGKTLTLSAGYGILYNGISFDRNKTYLTPHPGYLEYAMPAMVEGAGSVRVEWYDFERLQTYKLNQISIALGYKLNDNIHFGVGMNQYGGSSEDYQYTTSIGHFELIDQNEFTFSYDTLNTKYTGEADYSGMMLKLGLILDYDHFRLGISFSPGFDMTKDWSYTEEITYLQGDTLLTTQSQVIEGQDVMPVAPMYKLGVQLKPVDRFTFLLSYEFRPHGESEFSSDSTMATLNGDRQAWVDQSILQYGISYQVFKPLHVNILHRSVPQVFIPDGSPVKEAGPVQVSYRLGAELNMGMFGALDFGVEMQDLKYQDIYFSNTNYAHERATVLSMSYVYSLK